MTAQGQAVADMALASQLAEYGNRTNDPLAVLTAARIIQSIPVQEATREKTADGAAAANSEAKDSVVPDAAGLFAQAKEMAGDDMELVAMIDAAAKTQGTRGDITGPNNHYDEVLPGKTDVYHVTFRGGEFAEVAVLGDGDNDLDLYVYDEYGNLIEYDEDYTDQCYVSWVPRWTGEYEIRIKNRGTRVYSAYRLLTN
ncbi:MAG: hypothetical protein C0622_06550 [Desulfuromonas sp.]|nr:MAG: hypothetical protein C0622_06550 [Desulfuromonas sp.]